MAEAYRHMLLDYVEQATLRGGHTPHTLKQALAWHTRYRETGSMLMPPQAPVGKHSTGEKKPHWQDEVYGA